MKAIIIAIGNELTSGQGLDTNSAYLSRALGEAGVETIAHQTVPDDRAAIAGAIRAAAESAGLVIVTGGLGPTPDDLTREALADALETELRLDEKSLAEIEALFQRRQWPMVPENRVQAMIPAKAEAIANSCGTAPGIAAKLGGCMIFVTPGVPREMKAMFENHISARLPSRQGVILHSIIRLFGEGESGVAARIKDLMHRSGPVVVGTTVADGMVSIRIISTAGDAAVARQQSDQITRQICQRLGRLVVGIGEDASVSQALGVALDRVGQSLATAESCTGGMVGEMLTAVSGSSEYYLGGVIAYANQAKRDSLGVPEELLAKHGAVSEQVAAAMAAGVKERFGADWGIGVTGIAGPAGGTDEKPVGLVYTSLAGPDGVEVAKHSLAGDRYHIRRRAALAALNTLRLKLPETND
ncbi:MAG: competence/damage-inducible protein A [Phycisphaerae bacterium]|nr:competence/damage-inducible protein A [Phycisphaerae bacterium]